MPVTDHLTTSFWRLRWYPEGTLGEALVLEARKRRVGSSSYSPHPAPHGAVNQPGQVSPLMVPQVRDEMVVDGIRVRPVIAVLVPAQGVFGAVVA